MFPHDPPPGGSQPPLPSSSLPAEARPAEAHAGEALPGEALPGEIALSGSEWVLELRRVRAAAEAKRLESRAAQIELLLRRAAPSPGLCGPAACSERLPVRDWQELLKAAATANLLGRELPLAGTVGGSSARPVPSSASPRLQISSRPAGGESRAGEPVPPAGGMRVATSTSRSAERRSAAPAFIPQTPSASQTRSTPRPQGVPQRSSAAPRKPAPRPRPENRPPAATADGPLPRGRPQAGVKIARQRRRRRRSAAWLASTLAHAAVLVLLAGITISVAEPEHQITLDASPPRAAEAVLETVAFAPAEQPIDESPPPTPERPLATVSPLGMLAATEIPVDAPELRASSTETLASLQTLRSSTNLPAQAAAGAASQFFGAEGGGNHFVYLVDNSGSMASIARDGFDVARRELLRSIDALREDQRFYVMFFGEEVLRMRVENPATPDPRSVYATAENKVALRRWAMGISVQPGRWPEKALEFAFELRPDAIFLLTDGEMSKRVEPMIRQHNLVETLFEPPRPRSIIHTIGFYSRDGAEQMQKIAEVNGGSYHFIPPPNR